MMQYLSEHNKFAFMILTPEWQIAPDHPILKSLHMHPQISLQSSMVAHLKCSSLIQDHLCLAFAWDGPKSFIRTSANFNNCLKNHKPPHSNV